MLVSSPGLQILHFGLNFYALPSDTQEVTPVHLRDLRVLKIFPGLGRMAKLCPSQVLRLLAPGSKPLRLCIDGYYEPDIASAREFERFFSECWVERFYTRSVLPPESLLLHQASYLELVLLHGFESVFQKEPIARWPQKDESTFLPRPRGLHIIDSSLSEFDLRSLVDWCPDSVSLHSCDIRPVGGCENDWLDTDELLEVFPTVKIAECTAYFSEDPTATWDIL